MEFIGVDIGASSTRVVSKSGRIGIIPNNAVMIDNLDEKIKFMPYDDEIENALDVIIRKKGVSDRFPVHILYGSMAERYSRSNITPSVQKQKFQQEINYASIITAAAVSRINFGTKESFRVYLAVPPGEVKKAEEAFKKELVGQFTVELPKYSGGSTVNLNIEDVVCMEESVMAITSFFFSMSGSIREQATEFVTGNVLSMNIGASTTDLSMSKDCRYIEQSGRTIPVGGNLARDFLIANVYDEYGFELPTSAAEKVMAEGRIEIGNTIEDASKLVCDAKEQLAKDIVKRMELYFKSINMPIQTVRAIVVSGGGSLNSEYINNEGERVITVKPMSEFVTKELEDWCSHINVVHYGDEARLADLKGVYIRASVDDQMESARKNEV